MPKQFPTEFGNVHNWLNELLKILASTSTQTQLESEILATTQKLHTLRQELTEMLQKQSKTTCSDPNNAVNTAMLLASAPANNDSTPFLPPLPPEDDSFVVIHDQHKQPDNCTSRNKTDDPHNDLRNKAYSFYHQAQEKMGNELLTDIFPTIETATDAETLNGTIELLRGFGATTPRAGKK
ncbi:MAG: hypothetical protein KIT27_08840 [Legionellales bacterium]|nr:hypothetical protein [Legionellales bacterium]